MAVIGDFITVAGFSFSELEEQLSEAKDKVGGGAWGGGRMSSSSRLLLCVCASLGQKSRKL